MKKIVIRLLILVVVAAAAWGGYAAYKKLPQARQDTIATTKVRQGDILLRTYARGELRAVRSETLVAPNLFGTVQVTKLATVGSFAREKDLIVEFDDSELLSRIDERQLALDQLDEQIKKQEADLAIRENQDKVDLLSAQYAVRRSELQVKQNPLLGNIDQKKNLLALDEANQRLSELKVSIESRKVQAQAQLANQREQRQKGVNDLNREKTRLAQVKLLAPISGLVAIRQNRGQSFIYGQTVPDIREGDQVQPGMQIADVMDLSELEVLARVGELDRANLKEGQDVVMRLDALADQKIHGKIKAMSGTASASVFSSDPAKKFDVIFSVDMKQLLTALGASEQQIAKVLATAEANRNKAAAAPRPFGAGAVDPAALMAMARGGGREGGNFPGGAPQMGFSRGGPDGGGFGGRGGRGGEAGGGPGNEARQAMREVQQKILNGRSMRDLSPEEMQKVQQQVQEELAKRGITMPTRGSRGGNGGPDGGGRMAGDFGGRGGRGGRDGGGEGGDAGGGRGGRRGGGAQRYSQAEMDAAKLPPPPEEDSQLEVLMRPGLLADVEIIVEKIPNAVYIPAQAVFEREGKLVVFVKQGERLVQRSIKLEKRTENTMIIKEGLQAGEEVALKDPEKQDNKKDAPKGGGAPPMALPGAKG